MDGKNSPAEAMATMGDKILAAGRKAFIHNLAGPTTRVVDLAGKALVPGLNEPHNHFGVYGIYGLRLANLQSPPLGPVAPVSPLFRVFTAVNRITRNGEVLGPEYRLTPEEALRAVTLDAAWQTFDESIKGSIEAGKLADFTILAENSLAVPPERIKDIKVEEVIIGGKCVYKAT